jgi:hypothetical protein
MGDLATPPQGRGPDPANPELRRRYDRPPDYDFAANTSGPSLLDWLIIDSTARLWARTDSGCLSLVSLVVLGFACFVFFTILVYIR